MILSVGIYGLGRSGIFRWTVESHINLLVTRLHKHVELFLVRLIKC